MRQTWAILSFMCLLAASAHGASKTLNPGETLKLDRDFDLAGSDVLEANGTEDKHCIIEGNHHNIRSAERWAGHITLKFCEIRNLGAETKVVNDQLGPEMRAIDVRIAAKGFLAIENCNFDNCGGISVDTIDEASITFNWNTIKDNSDVPVNAAAHLSRPAFLATGNAQSEKRFQGNRVFKSWVQINSTNWTIGGDVDWQSNIIVGLRAGVILTAGNCRVRGNYIHALMPGPKDEPHAPYWSQVDVLTLPRESIAEQNILRGGNWVARKVEGEFRANVVLEPDGHQWMQALGGRIHHNIFAGGTALAGVEVLAGGDGPEIFNNVFDGGGQAAFAPLTVGEGATVRSLRNNVFCQFLHGPSVRPLWNESLASPSPARLAFADHNAFFNPRSAEKANYALAVSGKSERKDDGFAKNDLPKGGAVSEHIDPKFKGIERFPFSLDDIREKKVGVSQILEAYRNAYKPIDGSPLIDAGYPNDGPGTDIGAVEAGKVPPSGGGLTAIKNK